MMPQPTYQPKFRLLIGNKDVTALVDGDITIHQQESFITTLEFRLKHGIYFTNISTFRGSTVQFWGGYLKGQYKKMFVGAATFVYLDLEPSGLSFARCECYSSGYSSKTGENKPRVYPTSGSDRDWANCDSIKLSDLVKHLIKVIGAEVGQIKNDADTYTDAVIITDKLDVTFTKKSQFTSDGTDWGALSKLAEASDCALWEEYDEKNGWRIFFVARERGSKFKNTPDLVFIGRDSDRIEWNPDGTLKEFVNQNKFNIGGLKEGQIQLTNFSVTQDFKVQLTRANYRFDSDEYDASKDMYSEYDEKSGKWVYFLFDYDKDTTWRQKNPNVNPNFDTMDIEYMKNNFMRKLDVEKDSSMANKVLPFINRPYPKIRGNGSCRGNTSIMAHVSYSIYGIGSVYSSDSGSKWIMISCKHVWGNKSYVTEFEFIRP